MDPRHPPIRSRRWKAAVAITFVLVALAAGWTFFVSDGSAPRHADSAAAQAAAPAARRGSDPASAIASTVSARAARSRALPASSWPAEDAPVLDVMQQLAPLAEAGSAQAACRLAVELERCRRVNSNLEMAQLLTSPGPQRTARNAEIAGDLLARAEASVDRCRGATPRDFLRIYRYQAIAFDSGRLDMRRRLVRSPGLDRIDFLSDLDGWQDYSRRAQLYAAQALRARELVDLPMLIEMHVPAGHRAIPGTPRVRDDATFLALLDVARAHGVEVRPDHVEAERELREAMDEALRRAHAARRDALTGPWRASPPKQADGQAESARAAECNFG